VDRWAEEGATIRIKFQDEKKGEIGKIFPDPGKESSLRSQSIEQIEERGTVIFKL